MPSPSKSLPIEQQPRFKELLDPALSLEEFTQAIYKTHLTTKSYPTGFTKQIEIDDTYGVLTTGFRSTTETVPETVEREVEVHDISSDELFEIYLYLAKQGYSKDKEAEANVAKLKALGEGARAYEVRGAQMRLCYDTLKEMKDDAPDIRAKKINELKNIIVDPGSVMSSDKRFFENLADLSPQSLLDFTQNPPLLSAEIALRKLREVSNPSVDIEKMIATLSEQVETKKIAHEKERRKAIVIQQLTSVAENYSDNISDDIYKRAKHPDYLNKFNKLLRSIEQIKEESDFARVFVENLSDTGFGNDSLNTYLLYKANEYQNLVDMLGATDLDFSKIGTEPGRKKLVNEIRAIYNNKVQHQSQHIEPPIAYPASPESPVVKMHVGKNSEEKLTPQQSLLADIHSQIKHRWLHEIKIEPSDRGIMRAALKGLNKVFAPRKEDISIPSIINDILDVLKDRKKDPNATLDRIKEIAEKVKNSESKKVLEFCKMIVVQYNNLYNKVPSAPDLSPPPYEQAAISQSSPMPIPSAPDLPPPSYYDEQAMFESSSMPTPSAPPFEEVKAEPTFEERVASLRAKIAENLKSENPQLKKKAEDASKRLVALLESISQQAQVGKRDHGAEQKLFGRSSSKSDISAEELQYDIDRLALKEKQLFEEIAGIDDSLKIKPSAPLLGS